MMPESNDGFAQRHNEDCDTNFGAMAFDLECDRCNKINKVIMLKRKNTNNGCSVEESLTASIMATRLIETYKLTKGEIIDREYDAPVVAQRQQAQKTYHNQYGAAQQRHRYHARPRGFKRMSAYERFQYDEELTDE